MISNCLWNCCCTTTFNHSIFEVFRDWSLITGWRGYHTGGWGEGGGGHVKFYPYEKGGLKGFGHAEEGLGTTFFGIISMR